MFYNRLSLVDILLEEVIMYLRKSRSDDPTLTVQEVLRNHEKELDNWCESVFNSKVPQENRFKEVVSGEKMSERPRLQEVLREIEKPNIKYIITNEPSRLSRGYLDEIGKLVLLLRHNHITVITPAKIYNLEDEYDREAFERELKRGNEYLEYFKKVQKRGKDIKVSSGEYIGNVRPFGYKKIQYKEGKRTVRTLEIFEEEAEVVRMVYRWYAFEGMSIYGIAKKLNEMGIKNGKGQKWTPESGISELLRNPIYLGKIRWEYQKNITSVEEQQLVTRKLKQKSYRLYEGLHDAIIDEELFNKVQAVRKTRVPIKTKSKMVNPFAGLVYCKDCGRAYKLITDRRIVRLTCSDYFDCQSAGVTLDEMINAVCKVLEESIDNFSITMNNSNEDNIAEHTKQVELLEKQLKKLEQQELAQWQAQTNPDESQRMPAHIFKQLNEQLIKDKETVKTELEKMLSSAPKKINYEEKIVTFKTALAYLNDDNVECKIKNEYLKGIFSKILVRRDKATRLNREEAEKRGIPFEFRKPCWYKPPFEMEVFFRE